MKSIRTELTLRLCVATGGLLVLAGLAIFFAARQVMLAQFDDTLAAKAGALITAAEIDDDDFEIDFSVQDFAGFGSGGDYFEIRRENGRRLMRSPSLARERAELGKTRVPSGDRPRFENGRLEDGRPARFLVQRFVPKDDDRRRFRDLYLIAASPTGEMTRNLIGLGLVLAVTGIATLLLMIFVIRLSLRRGLRPLDQLSTQVRDIRGDQLDRRLEEDGLPTELQPLAGRLNESLAGLEESFERERRFSANAAHELRTPLAELKTMAEVGAHWPEEAGPDRCREMLTSIGELERLLDALSLLARAESGRMPVRREAVDLRSSIDGIAARFRAKADERNLAIHIEASGTLEIDPILWNTILTNVIGNAVDYSPRESTIQIQASSKRFEISNPAFDLEKADLDHLFDRFWRKNEARTSDGHSGLGLSIVRACASLLGAACAVHLEEKNRFRLEIGWPPG